MSKESTRSTLHETVASYLEKHDCELTLSVRKDKIIVSNTFEDNPIIYMYLAMTAMKCAAENYSEKMLEAGVAETCIEDAVKELSNITQEEMLEAIGYPATLCD